MSHSLGDDGHTRDNVLTGRYPRPQVTLYISDIQRAGCEHDESRNRRDNLNPIRPRGRAEIHDRLRSGLPRRRPGIGAGAGLSRTLKAPTCRCRSRLFRLLTDCLVPDICWRCIRLAIRFNPGSPWSRQPRRRNRVGYVPLVTVTPRPRTRISLRRLRPAKRVRPAAKANGQHFNNYGGTRRRRIEFIPAYNWEVIVAPPRTRSPLAPRERRRLGRLAGSYWQIWFISANAQNGDYIVTAFFRKQRSARHGCCHFKPIVDGRSASTSRIRQRPGRFRYSDDASASNIRLARIGSHRQHGRRKWPQIRRSGALEHHLPISFLAIFLVGTRGQLRSNWPNRQASGSQPGLAHAGHHIRALRIGMDSPTPTDQSDLRRRLSDGGDTNPGGSKQCGRHRADNLLTAPHKRALQDRPDNFLQSPASPLLSLQRLAGNRLP